MIAEFDNVYEDAARAMAYAKLEFPGTYYLAYRDLPAIIAEHVKGKKALDFGCGAGRSTRFLEKLGFETVGVDISEDMLTQARMIDPGGDYRLVRDAVLQGIADDTYDLVLSVFTFDNIPTADEKLANFREIKRALKPGGKMINLVSSPDIYTHEWASFTTKDFPENQNAKCGDKVKIVMTDVEDSRPVIDVIWPDADYQKLYRQAGLETVEIYKPLAKIEEPFDWKSETTVPPLVIYVLGK